MKTEVLRDVLVELGQTESYLGKCAPLDLWRAIDTTTSKELFELVETEIIRGPGKVRPADITITMRDGQNWVLCRDFPRGISLFDKTGVFKGAKWRYYKIPAGTILPEGLAIVRDNFNSKYGAVHHTIAPAHDMPLKQFKNLLIQLAVQIIHQAA